MKVLAISLSSFARNQTRELAMTPIAINIGIPKRKYLKIFFIFRTFLSKYVGLFIEVITNY